jgi:hypothetical protein
MTTMASDWSRESKLETRGIVDILVLTRQGRIGCTIFFKDYVLLPHVNLQGSNWFLTSPCPEPSLCVELGAYISW